MVAAGDAPNYAHRLGIQKDQVVQELGWDEDTDDDIRADIEDACGGELLDEDADEVIDVVLLWWRDGDGDLVDRLMDAITPLADDGVIWVLTPKTGKPGHVLPAEISESAPTAGLMQTSSANLGDWSASRLVQPKSRAAAGKTVSDRGRWHAGTGLHAPRPESASGFAERLPRSQDRAAGVLSAGVHRCLPGRTRRDPGSPAGLRERRRQRRWRYRWDRLRRTRFGRRRVGSCSPCFRISGRTARSPQAYGVFNDDAGFANRGTFLVDPSGIVRFAEMKQPGEARDQRSVDR